MQYCYKSLSEGSINLSKFLLILLAVTGFTFLSACDKDDPVEAVKNVATDPKLQGTFHGECASVDLDVIASVLDASARETLQFQGNSFTKVQTLYTEEDCKSPGLEIRHEGDFEIDADGVKGSPGGALNISTEKVVLVPRSQEVAEALNEIGFCGNENYKDGESTTVKNFDDTCPLEEAPKKYFGTYQVKNDSLLLDHPDVFDMAQSNAERETELKAKEALKKD